MIKVYKTEIWKKQKKYDNLQHNIIIILKTL